MRKDKNTPISNQTFATGFVRPKTTALFFDKLVLPRRVIYSSYGIGQGYNFIPKDVLFDYKDFNYKDNNFSNKSAQENLLRNTSSGTKHSIVSENLSNDDIERFYKIIENDKFPVLTMANNGSMLFKKADIIKFHQFLIETEDYKMELSYFKNHYLQNMVRDLRKYSFTVIPIYYDYTHFEKALMEAGKNDELLKIRRQRAKKYGIKINNNTQESVDYSAYEVIINSIKMIDEQMLEWEQVTEIRKDKDSICKLKAFRQWVDRLSLTKSKEEFITILNYQYEEYSAALSKHGVKTYIGGFSTILSIVSDIFKIIGSFGNILEIISGGTSIIANGLSIANKFTDKNKNPVAYYYDIKQLVKS